MAVNKLVDEFVKYRKSIGLTQKDVAEIVGTRQQQISRFESGTHDISLNRFCSWAEKIGMKISIK